MLRKQILTAVIGGISGIIGAVLVMAAGSFSPLGAQDEPVDLNVGKIFCTSLAVLNERGELGVWLSAADDGGRVGVYDKNGKMGVAIGAGEGGGVISVGDKDGKMDVAISVGEQGGRVEVFGKDGEAGGAMTLMSVGEHGGEVNVFGKDGGIAIMSVDELGGEVVVRGKDEFVVAGMGIDGYDKWRSGVVGVVGVYDGKTRSNDLRPK